MKKVLVSGILLLLFLTSFVLAAPDDADDDTVRDEFDMCPETPSGEILVDPEANFAYAGCSCEQIKAMIDNECIVICHEDLFEIREGAAGEQVSCPGDYCDGTTLMQFLPDGYGECEEGMFTPRNCGPVREEQAIECVGEGLGNQSFVAMPELEGNPRELDLSGAQAQYVFEEQLAYGSEDSFELLVIFDKLSNISVFNASLKTALATIIPQNINYGEDETDTLFYYADWPQMAGVPGTHKLTLELSFIQEAELRQVSQVIAYETYRRPVALPSGVLAYDLEKGVRTELNEEEKIYAQGIFDLAESKGAPTAGLNGIVTALDNVQVSKAIEQTGSSTVYDIHIIPDGVKGFVNLTIIEEIPKEAAEDLSHVHFSRQPDVILEDDPLIMWHFEEVEERVDLSYEVDRPVEVTGNTIVTAGDIVHASTPWHIIIPLVLIPLLVIIIIALPRARSKP